MERKTKKAQVILAAIDESSQSFQFLLLQTNEAGGLREAMEETHLKIESIVDIVDLGLSYEFVDQHGRKVHEKSFLIILDQKWDIKIDPKEHIAFKWINTDEVEEGIVKYRSNLETLEKAKLILRHWGI